MRVDAQIGSHAKVSLRPLVPLPQTPSPYIPHISANWVLGERGKNTSTP